MDVVDRQGRAAIVYWACARVGPTRLTYASWLLHAGGSVRTSTSVRPVDPPAGPTDELGFAHPSLALEARFTTLESPVSATLLDEPEGVVKWDVPAMRADARIRIGETVVEGLGYAETLRMTVEPWKLPLEVLHWGRALSPAGSAVWIRWQGRRPLMLLAVDGELCEATRIDERGVAWPDGEIALGTDKTLVDGPIVPRLARSLPGIRRLVPRAWRGAHETKWLCPLPAPDGSTRGWAIHEVARFPQADGT